MHLRGLREICGHSMAEMCGIHVQNRDFWDLWSTSHGANHAMASLTGNPIPPQLQRRCEKQRRERL